MSNTHFLWETDNQVFDWRFLQCDSALSVIYRRRHIYPKNEAAALVEVGKLQRIWTHQQKSARGIRPAACWHVTAREGARRVGRVTSSTRSSSRWRRMQKSLLVFHIFISRDTYVVPGNSCMRMFYLYAIICKSSCSLYVVRRNSSEEGREKRDFYCSLSSERDGKRSLRARSKPSSFTSR